MAVLEVCPTALPSRERLPRGGWVVSGQPPAAAPSDPASHTPRAAFTPDGCDVLRATPWYKALLFFFLKIEV